MAEILFMFSFGVAHPNASIAEQFAKSKQTPIWQSQKRSTLWSDNKFFKSNMDALTVLSIWDTISYGNQLFSISVTYSM